jgi:hypothetical protein
VLHTSFPTKYLYSDEIKEDEMGRECGINWRKVNACRDWRENFKERSHLEDLAGDR